MTHVKKLTRNTRHAQNDLNRWITLNVKAK